MLRKPLQESDMWTRMDRGKMICVSYNNADVYIRHGLEVTNILVGNFNEEIIIADVNFPGSWYDSHFTAESGLY